MDLSIAGEELSSVGSRHPERFAGLVYLDAAYRYAYYDRSLARLTIDVTELQGKLYAAGDMSNQNGGHGTRNTGHVVMLRQPVSMVTVAFSMTGKIERVL